MAQSLGTGDTPFSSQCLWDSGLRTGTKTHSQAACYPRWAGPKQGRAECAGCADPTRLSLRGQEGRLRRPFYRLGPFSDLGVSPVCR